MPDPSPAPLTPEELRELVDLEKKATSAPWNNDGDPRGPSCSIRSVVDVGVRRQRPLMQANRGNGRTQVAFSWSYAAAYEERIANATLIVALRNAAPRLLSELAALREENERRLGLLRDLRAHANPAAWDADTGGAFAKNSEVWARVNELLDGPAPAQEAREG